MAARPAGRRRGAAGGTAAAFYPAAGRRGAGSRRRPPEGPTSRVFPAPRRGGRLRLQAQGDGRRGGQIYDGDVGARGRLGPARRGRRRTGRRASGLARLAGPRRRRCRRGTAAAAPWPAPRHDRAVGRRQPPRSGSACMCCRASWRKFLPGERRLARQQFVIGDRQTILIAEQGDFAQEALRRGVQRRDGAHLHGVRRAAAHLGQAVDQAEVADLDVPADEEEVARLDVEVLQAVLLVEHVEDLGRLREVAQQLGPRHAGQAGVAVLARAGRAGCGRPAP